MQMIEPTHIRLKWDYSLLLEWVDIENGGYAEGPSFDEVFPEALNGRIRAWFDAMEECYGDYYLDAHQEVDAATVDGLRKELAGIRSDIEQMGYTVLPESAPWPFS